MRTKFEARMPLSSRRSFLAVLLFGLAALGLSACDVTGPLQGVNLVLDVEDISVTFGTVVTDVRADRPTIRTRQASPDVDAQDVREIRSIQLKTKFLTFTPASGSELSKSSADGSSSGTLELWVFFGSYPLPSSPITVTITDDVVTEVEPSVLSFESTSYTVDEQGLNQLLDDLGEDAPDLAAWEEATIDEVEAAINDALQQEQSPVSLAVRVTDGDLSGALTIDQFSIDARVTR